jgi:hypothetical protein
MSDSPTMQLATPTTPDYWVERRVVKGDLVWMEDKLNIIFLAADMEGDSLGVSVQVIGQRESTVIW